MLSSTTISMRIVSGYVGASGIPIKCGHLIGTEAALVEMKCG